MNINEKTGAKDVKQSLYALSFRLCKVVEIAVEINPIGIIPSERWIVLGLRLRILE